MAGPTRRVKDHYTDHPFSSPLKYGLGRKFVLNFLPERGRILDVGCGSGRTLQLVEDRGYDLEMHAMDINPHAINQLTTASNDFVGDALAIPFRDETFDAVLSIGVLHHTPAPLEGLEECIRVLKPGGSLVVALYNYDNPYRYVYRYGSKLPGWIRDAISNPLIQDQLFSPIAHFFTPDEAISAIEDRGVEVTDWKGTGIYPPFTGRRGSFMYYGGVKRDDG